MSIRRLHDPADPSLSAWSLVRQPRALAPAGLFAAEGRRVVRQVLDDPALTVHGLLLEEAALTALEPPEGLDVVVAPRQAIRQVCGSRFHWQK